MESLNKAAQAIRWNLVSGLLRSGGVVDRSEDWSLEWDRDRMGSSGAALGRGACLTSFDTAYFCWIDFGDVSDRVGGFSSASWPDFLRGGDSDRFNFKDQWA